MSDFLALLLGVVCAGIGGELFVRGTVGIARWARIAPGVVGATVAAFATSSPELSVSVSSALSGRPGIALGDALGSNVVNIALILGLALVISGIRTPPGSIRRDFPVAVLAPVLTGLLFLDGELSRLDGLILLSVFLAWLVATVIEVRKQRRAACDVPGERRHAMAILLCAGGMALLVAAGYLIVSGARGVAAMFGIDEFIVGATLVAVGTSTPELATTIVAKLRGHDDVGLGTIIGSNIFNNVFIVAIAAMIHPISVAWREVVVALGFGLMALALSYPPRDGFIGRGRGLLLLVLYAGYNVTLYQ